MIGVPQVGRLSRSNRVLDADDVSLPGQPPEGSRFLRTLRLTFLAKVLILRRRQHWLDAYSPPRNSSVHETR